MKQVKYDLERVYARVPTGHRPLQEPELSKLTRSSTMPPHRTQHAQQTKRLKTAGRKVGRSVEQDHVSNLPGVQKLKAALRQTRRLLAKVTCLVISLSPTLINQNIGSLGCEFTRRD